MVVFPNCKINLGLHITSKRADGFHNLETVFYPLPWQDALEAIRGKENSLSTSGFLVPGNTADNICLKAIGLLKKDFPQIDFLRVHLHKTIPMGAGLGGGSANGAFMLHLLNRLFHLKLTDNQLLAYSLQLGSDCPFFIINQPCFAMGRGENLQPFALNLSNYSFLVVHPGIHVNTGWAFTQITPATPTLSLQEIIKQPPVTWKDQLVNDFEKPVFKEYPAIADLKQLLYNKGAIYAAMSGSGSSVFGIFDRNQLPALLLPPHYVIKEIIQN